ncbi:hypothetical protein [Allochromatium palmeri]|nr:hypothetical protein [Allochromatium palmeri]
MIQMIAQGSGIEDHRADEKKVRQMSDRFHIEHQGNRTIWILTNGD